MIRGMTGFGRATAHSASAEVSVEIKSVNHRYFDLIVHAPQIFNLFEDRIRKQVQGQIKRGRVLYSINFRSSSAPKVYLNTKLARHYFLQLKKLSKELNLKGDIKLEQIARFEGVVSLGELAQSPEAFWPLINTATRHALDGLIKMRKKEGQSIYKDVGSKLKQARSASRAISQRRWAILRDKKRKMSPEEFAMFSRDRDINEEVSRLGFHLQNFKKRLSKSGAMGKELDFLSQEIQRETNTIGAKLPDKKITQQVIKIKGVTEQIREQLQNTE